MEKTALEPVKREMERQFGREIKYFSRSEKVSEQSGGRQKSTFAVIGSGPGIFSSGGSFDTAATSAYIPLVSVRAKVSDSVLLKNALVERQTNREITLFLLPRAKSGVIARSAGKKRRWSCKKVARGVCAGSPARRVHCI